MAALETVADFWKTVVVPDAEEFLAAPHDLRKAMHAAVSLYHLRDWGETCGAWETTDEPSLVGCREFKFIRGTCNALKHRTLAKRTVIGGAQDVKHRGLFDTGIFDTGIFGKGMVVLDAGPDGVFEFAPLVQAVYRMWQQELTARKLL